MKNVSPTTMPHWFLHKQVNVGFKSVDAYKEVTMANQVTIHNPFEF